MTPYNRTQLDTVKAILRVNNEDKFILANKAGSGKTRIMLDRLKVLPGQKLIICPKFLRANWAAQIEKWHPGTSYCYIGVGDNLEKDCEFVISYYDYCKIGNNLKIKDIFTSSIFKFNAIVLDEAHKIQAKESPFYTGVMKINAYHKPSTLIICTGTPVIKGYHDYYNYLHLLDPKRFATRSRFLKEFFGEAVRTQYAYAHPERPLDRAVFNSTISQYQVKVPTVEAHDDLVTTEVVYLDPSPDQIQLLTQAKNQGVLTRDGQPLVMVNALSFLTNIKQIASNPSFYGGSLGPKIELINLRSKEFKKIVVFSCFNRTLQSLQTFFGGRAVTLKGGLKDHELAKLAEKFQDQKSGVDIALVQTAVAAGYDLFKAEYCAFVDQSPSPAINEQALARVKRYGLQHAVTCEVIYVNAFHEEEINKALFRKELLQAQVEGIFGMNIKNNVFGLAISSESEYNSSND